MKVKNYLYEVMDLRKSIKTTALELEEARHLMTGLKAINYEKKEGASGGMNDKSPQEVYISLVLELEKKMLELSTTYSIKLLVVGKWLSQMDPIKADIITKRYLLGKKWPEVAESIGYSESHMFRLNSEALKELDEIADL